MPFAQVGDVSLFYTDEGVGETPLLFVHGYTADSHDWSWQLPHFRASHRVVAVDLRGHGASSITSDGYTTPQFAEDLRDLLDHLGIDRVVAIGHSLGALRGQRPGDREPAPRCRDRCRRSGLSVWRRRRRLPCVRGWTRSPTPSSSASCRASSATRWTRRAAIPRCVNGRCVESRRGRRMCCARRYRSTSPVWLGDRRATRTCGDADVRCCPSTRAPGRRRLRRRC